ncbi:cohesin-associated protein Pds5 [Guyanagaster necrorhizus]|uniref:Cohesin-associated protein Pds5 n=1 Tax=Guyanagaster necrorhizus TaxID=856835 RepID=A0A9P7VTV3_9AGAR|nr:cohesin-associated protein Pds5 [Guyanagaster necrorhizus MCA 3950]KAG7446844.1 cohesin-associated protein Pds5 [Guyanagaster necrorhizus MCA 3950]
MVAQTRHGGQTSPGKLAFKEKLVTKGTTTDALLKKLKNLHEELSVLDQDRVDTKSLDSVRRELILNSILHHKDKGVRAYAACCLADVLGLYAPEAPYTVTELVDIFQFIFQQLKSGLKGTEDTYYNQYFHVLESLSTVKSVVLVCDLPNADEMMKHIFSDFFIIVRRDFSKQTESFMGDILTALIDECHTLSAPVLEILMAQFMDKNAQPDQPAYRLVVQICNQTADKLQRHVSMYFTDIIVANSGDEELKEVRKAHELVKRIHLACPTLLHSVIPQLEEELRAEDVQLRSIATQVLGEVFADKGGSDLSKKYPTTWRVWLARTNDRSVTVRLKALESSRAIISGGFPEMREAVQEHLQQKLLDPDEKVRAAVCKIYGQLDYETVAHHVTEAQLRAMAQRAIDKKQVVRTEALKSLGKLYNLAYPQIESNDPIAISNFSWIPNTLFPLLGMSHEAKPAVEQALADYILPMPRSSPPEKGKSSDSEIDEVLWTDRLLNTMKFLVEERSINGLLAFTNLKSSQPAHVLAFIDACIQNNNGIIDGDKETTEKVKSDLTRRVKQLAALYPDSSKAADDLFGFAKLNDQTAYKLLKKCIDPQTDFKTLVKRRSEFLKKIIDNSPGVVSTMSILLRRTTYHVVNQSSIPTLLKRLENDRGREANVTAGHIHTLMRYISKHMPAIYKSHVSALVKAISDEDAPPLLVSSALQALSSVIQWDEDLALKDSHTIDRITRYVTGPSWKQAKFAARILASCSRQSETCTEVVESMADGLSDASPELLIAHIAALAQFALLAPDAFESKSDVITEFLVKELLMIPQLPDPDDDADEEWVNDDAMPDLLRAKILALKVFKNRSLAYADSDKGLMVSGPPLKIFKQLVEMNGALSSDVAENPKFMARLRLQAAISLLQLSSVKKYETSVATAFTRLTLVVQDSCYNVRYNFLRKIIILLYAQRIPITFNVVPFLTIHDPEEDIKLTATSYISTAIRTLPANVRVRYFDISVIRLMHLLAHHPDFSIALEDLQDIGKYLKYFADQVVQAENISLIYHYALKGKTVRDLESEEYSQNFYVICELAQEIIRGRARHYSWSVPSYPGKIKLPSDILRPHASPEDANKTANTVYLPKEVAKWAAELYKSAPAAVKKRAQNPYETQSPSHKWKWTCEANEEETSIR